MVWFIVERCEASHLLGEEVLHRGNIFACELRMFNLSKVTIVKHFSAFEFVLSLEVIKHDVVFLCGFPPCDISCCFSHFSELSLVI